MTGSQGLDSPMNAILVGGLEHDFYEFPIILGMSSSQLTSIFFRGVGIPVYHQPAVDGVLTKAVGLFVKTPRLESYNFADEVLWICCSQQKIYRLSQLRS